MLFRNLLSLAAAAASIVSPVAARGESEADDRPGRPAVDEPAVDEPAVDEIDQDGDTTSPSDGRWRVLSGLRIEQWIAPARDHLRFDVRLTLPEMAFSPRFSIKTFEWERLDVAEGRPERGQSGAVYHLLGARYRRDADDYGYFVGAHVLSWSGHGRLVTPWLGVRLGSVGGMGVVAEARLLGLGPLGGGELRSPIEDADLTLSVDGPRIGSCRIGARGRVRDVRQPDRHQQEQMASLGVEFRWGRRRLFLGLGIQHHSRVPPAAMSSGAPTADRMETAPVATGRIESTAVMLHLDAATPLPRSLMQ